jgi:hypothetical protein
MPDMLTPKNEAAKVVTFSKPCAKPLMLKCQLRTPGEETSRKPSPFSDALSIGAIQERLAERLVRLDAEQLQTVEIVVIAIQRGVRYAWLLFSLSSPS